MREVDNIAIIIAVTCVTSLVFFLPLAAYQLAKRAVRRQDPSFSLPAEFAEQQRDEIYRNMHDQVNPLLRSVMRNMERNKRRLRKQRLDPGPLDRDIDLLLLALNDIRSCTHGQTPLLLTEQGLVLALENLVSRLASSHNVTASVRHVNRFNRPLPFDQQKQMQIYRIALAGVENILLHSGCKKLELFIGGDQETFLLEFRHDGKGLTNEDVEALLRKTKGTGLRSCKARAEILNARLNYSVSRSHSHFKLEVPLYEFADKDCDS